MILPLRNKTYYYCFALVVAVSCVTKLILSLFCYEQMRIAQNMSMSGIDTDQDLDSSVYDSDNQHRRDSNDLDSEMGSRGGRGSPSFMDKVNALFRLVGQIQCTFNLRIKKSFQIRFHLYQYGLPITLLKLFWRRPFYLLLDLSGSDCGTHSLPRRVRLTVYDTASHASNLLFFPENVSIRTSLQP